MVAVFWAGIPVEVTQEAGVVPCCKALPSGHPFSYHTRHAGKQSAFSTPLPQGENHHHHLHHGIFRGSLPISIITVNEVYFYLICVAFDVNNLACIFLAIMHSDISTCIVTQLHA